MPRGDGIGPMRMGRMTGRGAGYYAGFAAPGYANPVGLAGGFGFGRGCGFRRMFHATGLPGWARFGYPVYAEVNAKAADERKILNDQAESLEKQLQQVKKHLSRLKEDEE